MGLLLVRAVQVKMLPFDNKSEFQVVLDAPRGTTLETSHAMASEVAAALLRLPEVTSAQVYAGTSSPFNFNGLVRHYFLRQGGEVSDVQVNLLPKGDRKRQSHAIAIEARRLVAPIAARFGARAKVAEIPPGPPVMSTLVAEVYAADDSARLAAAKEVVRVLETTPGVVDVDWSVQAPQAERVFRVDAVEATRMGASVQEVARTLRLALSGGSWRGWRRRTRARNGKSKPASRWPIAPPWRICSRCPSVPPWAYSLSRDSYASTRWSAPRCGCARICAR